MNTPTKECVIHWVLKDKEARAYDSIRLFQIYLVESDANECMVPKAGFWIAYYLQVSYLYPQLGGSTVQYLR